MGMGSPARFYSVHVVRLAHMRPWPTVSSFFSERRALQLPSWLYLRTTISECLHVCWLTNMTLEYKSLQKPCKLGMGGIVANWREASCGGQES